MRVDTREFDRLMAELLSGYGEKLRDEILGGKRSVRIPVARTEDYDSYDSVEPSDLERDYDMMVVGPYTDEEVYRERIPVASLQPRIQKAPGTSLSEYTVQPEEPVDLTPVIQDERRHREEPAGPRGRFPRNTHVIWDEFLGEWGT